jgi:hypothetical protein
LISFHKKRLSIHREASVRARASALHSALQR